MESFHTQFIIYFRIWIFLHYGLFLLRGINAFRTLRSIHPIYRDFAISVVLLHTPYTIGWFHQVQRSSLSRWVLASSESNNHSKPLPSHLSDATRTITWCDTVLCLLNRTGAIMSSILNHNVEPIEFMTSLNTTRLHICIPTLPHVLVVAHRHRHTSPSGYCVSRHCHLSETVLCAHPTPLTLFRCAHDFG